jgi:predicted NBD/HSP70 family sugar kinase
VRALPEPTTSERAAVAPELLRTINQQRLLDCLFTEGPATRPQLAKQTGLSLPTVIAALTDLDELGLVRVAGRPETSQGRPALLYEANARAGYVAGVDIGRSWLRVVITDLTGTTLSQIDRRNGARTSRALVDLVSRAVAEATSDAGLEPADITHTVVGSPGVYDAHRGTILYAANLPGWQRAGLTQSLADRIGSSLTVDNDANLAAFGEHTYGIARNCEHFVYAHIGTGVGLGLFLDGRLYQGAAGAAGEAGYLPIGEPLDQDHKPRRGMLEESLAADAVVRYARQCGMSGKITAEDVFTAARSGDKRACKAVGIEARHLAHLLASISAFLDPQLIVLGGGVGQNLDLLEPETRSTLAELTPLQPNITVGSLGATAVVRGAIASGIQRARAIAFAGNRDRSSA